VCTGPSDGSVCCVEMGLAATRIFAVNIASTYDQLHDICTLTGACNLTPGAGRAASMTFLHMHSVRVNLLHATEGV
jgi:hypothetical protein